MRLAPALRRGHARAHGHPGLADRRTAARKTARARRGGAIGCRNPRHSPRQRTQRSFGPRCRARYAPELRLAPPVGRCGPRAILRLRRPRARALCAGAGRRRAVAAPAVGNAARGAPPLESQGDGRLLDRAPARSRARSVLLILSYYWLGLVIQ